MTKIKYLERSNSWSKTNIEYFNCEKKGHYAKDCRSTTSNEKTSEKISEEGKRACWKRNQAKTTRSTINLNNSDAEPYLAGRAFMTWSKNEESGMWYLDSYALRYICHDQERFIDLRPKTYQFVIARGDIIQSE